MPTFAYTARTLGGDLRNATIEAPSREDAVLALRKLRLAVVKIEEQIRKPKSPGKVPMKDVVIFTRQFSTMINAGLPLVQALDILAKQSDNKALQQTTRAVVFDVESGTTVSEALGRHPKVFSDLYVNMVAAGEAGGILDTILMRLATFLEKADALVRKVKGAMIYPAVISGVAVLCITVLLWKVIPVLENMVSSVNLELPLPTRVVVGLSRFVNGYWWAVLAGGAGAAFLVRRYYATADGRLVIDRLLLRLPVLGDVLRKAAVSRFTRTLGTLISSGVSILDGLEITARTAGNRVIQDAILASRASIAGGDTIAAPLAKSQVFPPMVISMIAVGEQTGGLDEMLTKIADFYDNEVDAMVKGLTSLIEPLLIVFMGVLVGFIAISVMTPIFKLVSSIH
jgi:type IV pilus assembly protein PilC